MNELFLLDKKIDLHNGTNYPEWHTLRVVKPSQLTIEGEVPETISLSISQRANKQDKGVSIVVSFDLTPMETKALILALQGAVKKEEPTPEVNYIGTKMYLTERGRELYGYSDIPLTSEWEVVVIEGKDIVTLHNKEYGYETKATYVSLFMFAEQRDFTFEKPEEPSVKQKPTSDYIGKKVRATKAGEEHRRAQGLENFDNWEILGPDREGELKIKSPQSEYTIYTTWDALFGETPHFEIIEEPDIQLLSEPDFKTMPPPFFASSANYTTMPRPELNNTQTILDKAKDLIYGDRVNDYGKTSDNFKNICVGWEIIFKDGFTPERVGLAMAWLKICRASTDNCEKEDSLIDLAGYAGCIEKIKKNL